MPRNYFPRYLDLKFLFIILISFLNVNVSHAQSKISKNITIEAIECRIDSLNKLYYKYRYSNQDTVKHFLKEALALSDSIGYTKGKVEILTSIGMTLSSEGKNMKALSNYIEALKLSHSLLIETKDENKIRAIEENLCGVHLSMGIVYGNLQEVNAALMHYSMAEKIAAKANSERTLRHIMGLKGILYQSMGNHSKAKNIYLDLLENKNKKDTTDRGIPILYFNLGEAYCELNKHSEALYYNTAAYDIFEKMKDKIGIVAGLQGFGRIYLKQDKLSKAHTYCHKSLAKLDGGIDDHRSRAQTYLLLGQIHFKNKLTDSAAYYSQKSLDLSLANNLNETALKSSEHLIEVYKSEKTMYSTEDIYKLNTLYLELQSRLLSKTNEIELTDVINRDPIITDRTISLSDKFQITQIQDRVYKILLVCIGIFLFEIVFIRFIYKSKS